MLKKLHLARKPLSIEGFVGSSFSKCGLISAKPRVIPLIPILILLQEESLKVFLTGAFRGNVVVFLFHYKETK